MQYDLAGPSLEHSIWRGEGGDIENRGTIWIIATIF